jgi:hypothetical protein
MKLNYLILVTGLLAFAVNADNSTLDAAIGGGVGGAAGAAIGNEIGGRDGAIIGGALGAAVGTAVNTDEAPRHTHPPAEIHYRATPPHYDHPHHYHCPPGQRKKGRC